MMRTAKRRSFGLPLALVVGLLASSSAAPQEPIRLPGVGGGELTEGALEQGSYVVVVWAAWSPRCRDIAARVNRIAERWGGKARVVTVNFMEERPAVQEFLRSQRVSVPVYLDADGAFSKKHAVTTLPSLLVLKDGRIGYRGKLPDDENAVISQVLE